MSVCLGLLSYPGKGCSCPGGDFIAHTHLLSRYSHFSLAFFTSIKVSFTFTWVKKRMHFWNVLFYSKDGSAQKKWSQTDTHHFHPIPCCLQMEQGKTSAAWRLWQVPGRKFVTELEGCFPWVFIWRRQEGIVCSLMTSADQHNCPFLPELWFSRTTCLFFYHFSYFSLVTFVTAASSLSSWALQDIS